MKGRCLLFFTSVVLLLAWAAADKTSPHKLTKRQVNTRSSAQRAFPLSRSRQFPPPEELEDSEAEDQNEDSPPSPVRRYSPPFRGRQQPPDDTEDVIDDYTYTEAPTTTTVSAARPPNRLSPGNRLAGRPRFGGNTITTVRTTAAPARATTAARFRNRLTSAPAQRIDVAAEIPNRAPPQRASPQNNSGFRTTTTKDSDRKPVLEESSTVGTRRVGTGGRGRGRGRLRTRASTTTTTTTTTTAAPPTEDYYYYYYDEDEEAKQQLATTTTTTTTTTTPKPASVPRRPALSRGRVSLNRGRVSSTSARPAVKFDPESQFQPPPEETVTEAEVTRSTKRFTTSSTTTPVPGVIPPHLRSKYKPRSDGRFIDYYRDPNRPRELKGFDLTDYPFYIRVPEDIVFDCDDKKDGYYASVPHNCQLFHYCFAGSRYDFLCANYTLYDQTTFTCRFANNVDCPSSEKFYYRNDDLWKETTTIPPEEQKKKKIVPKDEDYEEEEEEYDDDEYYDDEEDDKRSRRPSRRRNRRRKNRRKPDA